MTHTYPDPRRHDGSAAARRAAGGARRLSTSRCRLPAAPKARSRRRVPVRIGGFGGAEGLADYLRDEKHRPADRRDASLCRADFGQCGRGCPACRRRRCWRCAARPGSRSKATAGRWSTTSARPWRRSATRRDASSWRSAGRKSPASRPRRSTAISSAASIRSSRRLPCPMRPTFWRAVRFRRQTSGRCSSRIGIDVIVAKNSGGAGDLWQDRRGARARHRR